MRWGGVLGTLAGVALAAWLLASFGLGEVTDLLARAGWGIVAVVLFHWVQILFSAMAWRAIAEPLQPQPLLSEFVALRWIRESVNSLLPVAHIGGAFVAARILHRRGFRLARPLSPGPSGM